ncbi:MAG: hypothetical protein ACYC6V_02585 [Bacillota bacterium]
MRTKSILKSPPQAEEAGRAARNGDEVRVSVIDQALYRGPNAAVTRPEGLGLGLYITRLPVGQVAASAPR